MSCDPVGVPELADRLGVRARTPHVWLQRELMPPAEYTVSGNKAWNWSTILRWAGLTGRIHSPAAIDEYRKHFGEEPRAPRLGGQLEAPVAVKPAPPKRKGNTTMRTLG